MVCAAIARTTRTCTIHVIGTLHTQCFDGPRIRYSADIHRGCIGCHVSIGGGQPYGQGLAVCNRAAGRPRAAIDRNLRTAAGAGDGYARRARQSDNRYGAGCRERIQRNVRQVSERKRIGRCVIS